MQYANDLDDLMCLPSVMLVRLWLSVTLSLWIPNVLENLWRSPMRPTSMWK